MAEEHQPYYADAKDVTTAGTPEALTDRDLTCESVAIIPKDTNTNNAYVADPVTTTKLCLIPSGGIVLPVRHPAFIQVDVDTNGEGVYWVAV